ncbi:8501_t:CDS:2 [Gigaspora margarita]|uniref:8501_t:CDS:1 n=1 Tax=Gigaspora margarita TaxID=4874 RepID=A0ABN7UR47_GIGMA|nr:8501_t:CDS:2 [Gigaspora margarita]
MSLSLIKNNSVELKTYRKTEQSEIKNYEKIGQVLEVQNKKEHSSLVKKDLKKARQTEVLYYDTKLEWLLNNEEEDNKQNISFRKEKEIYKECKERQGADDNRIFELKRRSTWKTKIVNKRARYPGYEEKVQGFRREYALKNKKELMRKGKEKEN